MNNEYYTSRSRKLFLSGYPVELITLSSSALPTVSSHSHEEIELQFVSKGHIEFTCNGEKTMLYEGDIVFINANVPHFVSFTNEDSELCSIIVHPTFIFDFEQLELKNKYINPIIYDNNFSHLLIRSNHHMYADFLFPLERLVVANAKKVSGYEMLSRSYIMQFWNLLYEVHGAFVQGEKQASSPKTELQDEQRVRVACTYIYEHYSEAITLEDISDSILVSKSECCRCFKRVCYLSPFEYLMKYRIVQATKHMQQNLDDSISDVAGAVGFNNISYFNKVFKKFMNCTPSQYKKSLYAS
jgi:AraC-like DNA-binding protein